MSDTKQITEQKGGFIWALIQMSKGKKCYVEEYDFEHYYQLDECGNLIGCNGMEQNFNMDFLTYTWIAKND